MEIEFISCRGEESPWDSFFWNDRLGLSSACQQNDLQLSSPRKNSQIISKGCTLNKYHRILTFSDSEAPVWPPAASAAWCSTNLMVSLCPEAQKPAGLTTSWGLSPVCKEPPASRAEDFCASNFLPRTPRPPSPVTYSLLLLISC